MDYWLSEVTKITGNRQKCIKKRAGRADQDKFYETINFELLAVFGGIFAVSILGSRCIDFRPRA